ncbi:unnamed protein product [Paramecium sonneborni]|uniref:Alpha-type protein kinase domain-containing protein n=1 Tax=Paramecium sonneborni TaxID=65129 RepID=A0A8S1RB14_9CILI|nr:unnamed protein product [Paramecium sonneborni]
MIQNEFNFEEVCDDSQLCQNNQCQLNHSRVFVGVCITFLRIQQKFINDGGDLDDFELKKCKKKDCILWHFSNDKFKDQAQKQTINGVFPHNLCPKGCNLQNCRFLHREWAQNVCFDYILKNCNKKPKCDFEHVAWTSLKDKAKDKSFIKTTTPEQVCEKVDCNCDQHPAFLENYCIPFLKGWCPKQKCLKNHIDWEKINNKIGQKNALKSCIVLADERKKKIKSTPNGDDIELLLQSSELANYKKWFLQQNIIDVVFIMDLTGSMQPWKELMQKTIAKIIDQFLKSINGYQVRVAFVGYRDVCDQDKLVFWSFTKKVEDIQNFITKLETKGGGDEAEDVVSGFEQALKLNFSHHPDSLLCTFLLADAPCHGRDYHNIQSDDLIDKMPKNYFEKVLEKYQKIKKNNFLCCVKINNRTDIMFQKMKAVFPLITITTEKKPEDLCELVGFTLRQSVTESRRLKEQANNKFLYVKATFIKMKVDNSIDNIQPDKEYWEDYRKMVDSLIREGETGLKVTLDINELNKVNQDQTEQNKDQNNSSTYIFKAFDAINNREIILKLPKELVDNNGKNTDQQIKNAEQQAKVRFYSSAYACQMAYFFNQKLKEYNLLNEMQPIFYAHPILYNLEKPFYGMKQIYGETFLNIQYKFEKHTNNDNYCKPDSYYFTAFSHFSYYYSQKLLVITDLQGCNNILSDPSIQTSQQWQSILDEDLTNQKEIGILKFSQNQHKNCSYLCEKLKLSQLSQNLDQNKCSDVQLQHICGICYECDEFVSEDFDKTPYDKDAKIQPKKFTFKCNFCLNEAENPVKYECRCCDKIYIFQNINQQLKNLTNLNNCNECKAQCNDKNRYECYYCKGKCQKLMKTLKINDQTIYVCENAYQYLQAFSCKKCNKPYNMKSVISVENYTQRSFVCC